MPKGLILKSARSLSSKKLGIFQLQVWLVPFLIATRRVLWSWSAARNWIMNAQRELSLLKEYVGKSKMIEVTWAQSNAAQPNTAGGWQRLESFFLLHISYNWNGKESLSLQKHDFRPTYVQNLTGKWNSLKKFGQLLALRSFTWTARVSSSSEFARSASYLCR